MTGSCVTVPCSFDVEDKYEQYLNNQCTAIWRSTTTGDVAQLTDRNPQTGDLTKKNCTTTFSNMQTGPTKDYYFRIDCNNPLLWSYSSTYVKIEVTDNFPSPTLTPSTLKIKEGESVSLTCSAPAPCLPHPPTLIWTPKLGDIQETLQENQDKTKFKTSVMNFTASHLYNKQNISCTAGYKKQDGSSDAALTTSLIPDVLYSPKNVTVSVSPSGSVVENSNVTLTCNSDANPAEQNYTWYRADGGQETVIGTGKIFKMKVKTDTKMFFCKAVNEIGKQPSNITHIDVLYSPKNVTVSVSPSGSILENSNVTLTCNSDANPAEQNYSWYRADGGQETVFGTGKILNITVSMNRKSFFCKAENDVGEQHSSITHIDVLFPARILFSSKCMKTSNQVSCFCDTAGNPSPTTHWNLHGKPITQPSQMCFSYNSLGSASKGFCVRCLDNSKENESQILTPVLIGSTVTFLLIICALLVVVWFQKTHYKPKSVAATSGQHEAKEQTKADNSQPSTGTDLSCNNPEKMSKSSADKSEDVVYARLKWRENTKVKEEDIYVNLELSDGSCLNEKKCENGGEHSVSKKEEIESMRAEDKIKNIRKESEVVYAQVKFQTKTPESQ
uniref:Ig-like domain-containing protein n=1 Tax=Poecilia mexicana TaxID=48701 RepID=A0A3B3WDW6_9TELE